MKGKQAEEPGQHLGGGWGVGVGGDRTLEGNNKTDGLYI